MNYFKLNQIADRIIQSLLRADLVNNDDIFNYCNDGNKIDKHILECTDLLEKTSNTTSKIVQSMISDKLVMYAFMIRVFEKLGPKCFEEEEILIKHIKDEIERLKNERR